MQAGTYVIFDRGDTEERAIWYERYPRDPAGIGVSDILVGTGDAMAASLTLLPGASHRWRMAVRDLTLGASWSRAISYNIAHSDADFIVEDPTMPNGRLAPFANWGDVRFSGMQVRVGQHWRPAGSLRALRIGMIQHGNSRAAAGPLGPDGTGFTATQPSVAG